MAQGLVQLFKYRATTKTSPWFGLRPGYALAVISIIIPPCKLVGVKREKLLLYRHSKQSKILFGPPTIHFSLGFPSPTLVPRALLSWISFQTNKDTKPHQTVNRSQLSPARDFNLKIIRFLASVRNS